MLGISHYKDWKSNVRKVRLPIGQTPISISVKSSPKTAHKGSRF